MTTTLADLIAARLHTAIKTNLGGDAEDLAQVAVMVQQAGLMVTPVAEESAEASAADGPVWPDGVEVITSQTDVYVQGEHAGFVVHPSHGIETYLAYRKAGRTDRGPLQFQHATLESAAAEIIRDALGIEAVES